MELNWACKKFEELTVIELYKILQQRSDVFVVEQNCVYHDIDNKDLDAYHLMGWDKNELVAYTRLIKPGISYEEASIGRVLTHINYRRYGFGKELMKRSIEQVKVLFMVKTIRISAQCYLQRFYEEQGFIAQGEAYLEDDIPHIEMLYTS
ncbi:GNAT family N-acetyltransferase [Pedobacter montanisoli]|uniref:GNAT family N-acetyltransferase n=1 Tax=Pedobacter montanisoli TaxID=2923277 RepID=A0ABS9ZUB3_9SPHI|nr:GNAT family N-acetyltransferase [Pedobacter montanisoli]MCJ0741817.1 GNAT family N-acetyltransferase [Pedobacter montanisoli]